MYSKLITPISGSGIDFDLYSFSGELPLKHSLTLAPLLPALINAMLSFLTIGLMGQ